MDEKRFDNIVRILARGSSRRSILRGFVASLAGGLLGAAGSQGAGAIACRGTGRVCRVDGNCCSGRCVQESGLSARRVCACPGGGVPCRGTCLDRNALLSDPDNCGACGHRCPGSACARAVCQAGVCAQVPLTGQSCDAGPCLDGTCQADGSCRGTPRDCSALDGDCATGHCDPARNACVPQFTAAGTPCVPGGNTCITGATCDGAGSCAGGSDSCTADECTGKSDGTACGGGSRECCHGTCLPLGAGCAPTGCAGLGNGTSCGPGRICCNGTCLAPGKVC